MRVFVPGLGEAASLYNAYYQLLTIISILGTLPNITFPMYEPIERLAFLLGISNVTNRPTAEGDESESTGKSIIDGYGTTQKNFSAIPASDDQR